MYISRLTKKLISAFLVILLGVTPLFTNALFADASAEDVSNYRDQLEDAKKDTTNAKNQVDKAQKDVNNLTGEKDKIQATYNNYSNQLNAITADLNATQKKIDDTNAEIAETQKELDKATAIAEDQYASMKRRIQFMYENASYNNVFVAFITANSMGDFLNRADSIEQLSNYDRQMLNDYIDTQNQIQAVKDELLAKEEKLAGEKKELDAQHDKMDALVSSTATSLANKKNELTNASATLKNAKEKLAEMQAVEASIQDLYDQAAIAYAQKIAAEGGAASNSEGMPYSASDEDRDLLAGIIYAEAGNQGLMGQVYVGSVVMNRVFSGKFPNTIPGVVYQSGQFTPAGSGRLEYYMNNGLVSKSCYDAADMVLAGTRYTHEYFFCTRASAVRNGLINEDYTSNGKTSGVIYLAHYFWHYGSGSVIIL